MNPWLFVLLLQVDIPELPVNLWGVVGVLLLVLPTILSAYLGYRQNVVNRRVKEEKAEREAQDRQTRAAQLEVRKIRDSMMAEAKVREQRLLRDIDDMRIELREMNRHNGELQATIGKLEASNARLELLNRDLQVQVETLQKVLVRMENKS